MVCIQLLMNQGVMSIYSHTSVNILLTFVHSWAFVCTLRHVSLKIVFSYFLRKCINHPTLLHD